jgi:hypothetical protein
MSTAGKILKDNRTFWHNPAVVIASVVVVYLASQMIGMLMASPFFQFLPSKNARIGVTLCASFIALYGLVSIAKTTLGFSWSSIGVRKTKLQALLAIIPIFILYALVSTVLTELAARYIPWFDAGQVQNIGMVKTGRSNIVIAFVSLVVITPIYEELIFRGILFSGLRKKLPFIVSALIASALFGLAHMQPNLAVDTFVLGVFLCLFVEKTKSIVPGIALHALKNFIAFGVLFLGWKL